MFHQLIQEKTISTLSKGYRNGLKKKYRLPILWLLLVLIPSISGAQTTIPISAASKIALGIETEAVLSMDAFAQVTATGVVVAPRGSAYPITSPFNGVMLEALAFPGMSVTEGQEIVLVHSPEYSTAKAEQETQRLTMVHNEHLFESAVTLHELGLRSELELDEARHEMDSARLEYTAMTDRLSSVVASEKAGQFVLTSPVNGVVNNIAVRQGVGITASMPLATIFTGSHYWARIQVPETGANQVELEAGVKLSETDSLGRVVSIEPEIDPASRSLEVVIELPDDVRWRIGQLVSASFLSSIEPGSRALPEQSIVRIGGDTFVFVEVPSGFRLTPVTIVSRSRDVVIVSGGIEAEDRVAISGTAALKNIVEGA